MEKELKLKLLAYLEYLLNQPETRMNNQLIDCVVFLMQQKPDTEDSLSGGE